MDDLAMTCSDIMNALKMLNSSEKHTVSRANDGYTKQVVIARWPTRFYVRNNFLQILIYSTIF